MSERRLTDKNQTRKDKKLGSAWNLSKFAKLWQAFYLRCRNNEAQSNSEHPTSTCVNDKSAQTWANMFHVSKSHEIGQGQQNCIKISEIGKRTLDRRNRASVRSISCRNRLHREAMRDTVQNRIRERETRERWPETVENRGIDTSRIDWGFQFVDFVKCGLMIALTLSELWEDERTTRERRAPRYWRCDLSFQSCDLSEQPREFGLVRGVDQQISVLDLSENHSVHSTWVAKREKRSEHWRWQNKQRTRKRRDHWFTSSAFVSSISFVSLVSFIACTNKQQANWGTSNRTRGHKRGTEREEQKSVIYEKSESNQPFEPVAPFCPFAPFAPVFPWAPWGPWAPIMCRTHRMTREKTSWNSEIGDEKTSVAI